MRKEKKEVPPAPPPSPNDLKGARLDAEVELCNMLELETNKRLYGEAQELLNNIYVRSLKDEMVFISSKMRKKIKKVIENK